jgi:hypothetical protein
MAAGLRCPVSGLGPWSGARPTTRVCAAACPCLGARPSRRVTALAPHGAGRPSPEWSGQRLVQVPECVREVQVGRVVNRTCDDRDGVVGERVAQRRQQVIGRPDPVPTRPEALRVGNEVWVGERCVAALPQLELHLPFDEAVLAIDPDEDNEWRVRP